MRLVSGVSVPPPRHSWWRADGQVFLGPAADVMPQVCPGRSVDMVYLDPPFFTQKVWTGKAGSFSDIWAWDESASCDSLSIEPRVWSLIQAMQPIPAGRAYLVAMARLLAAARVALKLTGSIWLHCDDTAHAHLRVVMDAVFGPPQFLGEIVWKRTTAHAATRGWGRIHDTICVYGRSRAARLRLAGIRGEFVHGDPLVDPFFIEGFCEDRLASTAKERADYPTQKPISLLKRLIQTATREADTVVDMTCGSGTTLVAAVALGRQAIGFDQSEDAVRLASARLGDNPHQGSLFGEAA